MRYFLIAGEASGDMHAARLMEALLRRDAGAEFFCFGGDKMKAVGGKLLLHHRHMAFMGFWEVAKNLRTIAANLRLAKEEISRLRPDALILIDFPGFNLRIADWAKKQGLKVYYYISPQIWAWKEKRIEKIRRVTDRMFVILPFEKDFYAQRGMEVTYTGHPLLEQFPEEEAPQNTSLRLSPNITLPGGALLPPEQRLIALLPGSRKQEVQRILPVMLKLPPRFPQHRFLIAAAPGLDDAFFHHLFEREKTSLPLLRNQNRALLQRAEAAVVCSGTATLETALLGTPQVVGYRSSALSYAIAKRLVKVPYISLVNLILNAPLLEELIQNDFNPARLEQSLHQLLQPQTRQRLQKGYHQLRALLHPPIPGKTASEVVAEGIGLDV